MSRIYRRKDRRSRDVYYIDYAVCHPETGEQIRKRERVGYSRPEAKSALESRKTDIRRGKFDGDRHGKRDLGAAGKRKRDEQREY